MEFNANTSLAVMQLSGKVKFTHKVLVGNMDNPSIDNQNQATAPAALNSGTMYMPVQELF